ncbi:MAG TPA: ATP phosphoribosyltransferase regulatory subunit [Polyangiaceae bacterium]|nr:ATP phosphoribosyltransferase regulatory subunit [Polyangiaceae bacterium]
MQGHGSNGALEHPLPAGMRDLLPPVARRQGELARRVTRCFELHGYEIVTLPVFEYAEVLERGLGALASDEVLRFVEPESGEVVALRPDMTPQIARILATRLSELPGPARLCYHGSVMRRPRERARRHRQIFQAGVELLGLEGPAGDLEILRLASEGVRAAGLSSFVFDLGHARIAAALLETQPAARTADLVDALAIKDQSEVSRRALAAGFSGRTLAAISELSELHGGAEIWPRAERLLVGTAAEPALRELRQIWDAVQNAELAPELLVDLSETRNFAYYTGLMFQIHADGPGSPIGAGGRYDSLLARFGAPRAAAGFALSLDHLAWALESIGREESNEARLLTVGASEALLAGLRALGIACAAHSAASVEALDYARAWRYSHVLDVASSSLVRVSDQNEKSVLLEPQALASILSQPSLGLA